jgi:hypothetical protein
MLPQLSCAGERMARFRRGEAINSVQHCTQGTAKFEFLSLSFWGIGQ